jgi:RNA polymerase sigma-70 factor (ECF subfamily)
LDTNITDRLKKREEAAFRELIEEYGQLVFRTCMGILHDRQDADDVTQEVFIEVFRSVDRFRADARISTWLYRIALNKSLNYLRDNRRHRDSLVSREATAAGLSAAVSGEGPLETLQAKERKEILERTLSSLPEKQKKAFVLSKYEDLSYKQISEVMKLSVSSVESLIFRAKKNLQKKLLDCYGKSC